MPTYEYECLSCKKHFERFQKFADPPVSECPECGSAVRKVLFPAGVVFKGSGWYITDSRSTPSESSSSSSGSSDSKTETKAESKTASKSDGASGGTSSSSGTSGTSGTSTSSTKSESGSAAKA